MAPGGNEFWLGSDGIIPTWSTPGWTKRFALDLVAEFALDADDFYRIASTIGGYIIFPRNRASQTGWTINQSRGMNSAIADRFDLTLECIRRHYSDPGAVNPLGERLGYYNDLFALFGDFDTYVRFFLLEDLVIEGGGAVRSLVSGHPLTGSRGACLRRKRGGVCGVSPAEQHFRHGAQRADSTTRLLAGS